MKKYVKVIAVFYPDGTIVPRMILRDDDVPLEISSVCDVRRAASLSAGGCGIRYSCMCRGRRLDIYLEDSRWFVEDSIC